MGPRLLLGLACLVTVVNLGARLDREMVDGASLHEHAAASASR